jgi:RimJ/RimL family protein N-acetyltransferase
MLGAVDVHSARLEDAEGFAAVVAAVADEGCWIVTEPPVDVAALANRVRMTILAGEDELWVLRSDGEVVGCLGLHATKAAGVVTLGMSVLGEARGRGGGRALLAAALAHARDEPRIHKVELEVFPDAGTGRGAPPSSWPHW